MAQSIQPVSRNPQDYDAEVTAMVRMTALLKKVSEEEAWETFFTTLENNRRERAAQREASPSPVAARAQLKVTKTTPPA